MVVLYRIIYGDVNWDSKKRVLLYIDSETTRKAKELGLNTYKVSENALKEAISSLECPKPESDCPDGVHCGERGVKCEGWGSSSASIGDISTDSRKTPLFCSFKEENNFLVLVSTRL